MVPLSDAPGNRDQEGAFRRAQAFPQVVVAPELDTSPPRSDLQIDLHAPHGVSREARHSTDDAVSAVRIVGRSVIRALNIVDIRLFALGPEAPPTAPDPYLYVGPQPARSVRDSVQAGYVPAVSPSPPRHPSSARLRDRDRPRRVGRSVRPNRRAALGRRVRRLARRHRGRPQQRRAPVPSGTRSQGRGRRGSRARDGAIDTPRSEW